MIINRLQGETVVALGQRRQTQNSHLQSIILAIRAHLISRDVDAGGSCILLRGTYRDEICHIGHPCTRVFLGTRARITTAVETNPVQPARFESTPGNRDSRTEMVVQETITVLIAPGVIQILHKHRRTNTLPGHRINLIEGQDRRAFRTPKGAFREDMETLNRQGCILFRVLDRR